MRAMSGVLSHSGRPNSAARVTLSRYIVSRSLRSSAYCITGRYDGACRVNFQPALPSACAASRAACSPPSGIPAILFSSTTIENALVASSRFSENFAPSRASSSWIAAGREVDDFSPCFRQLNEFGGIAQRPVFLEQRLVLPELGPVLGNLRQVGVVSLAQRRAVQHRVQVRNLAPGPRDALVCVFQRGDECIPVGARMGHRRGRGAAFGEQLIHRRGDMLGLQILKTGQSGKIQQWIHVEAARTQFSSRSATVIGPTPPGTGVIQPATFLTASKSTSPASVPSARRLMPTSMTHAPRLTIAVVTR